MTALEDLLSPKAKEELQLNRLRELARQNKMQELLDPVLWIEKNFYIPELMGPLELQPYQKAVLRESQRKDENSKFVYSIVVWSDIKKSAKSTIAAAMALYIGHVREWGSIKIIANKLEQADSRVAYYLRRSVELNPRMENIKQVRYLTTLPNHTTIQAIPISPGGEAGGNDDLLIFSEMWAAKHKAMKTMWTEMTLSPTKFGYSQRWVETYAGSVGEASTLEQLYIQGVKEGKQLDLSYTDANGRFHDLKDLEIFANGPLLCLWNTKPRCPWQVAEYYASEATVLTPNEFNRVHRNQWTSSTDTFVPPEWWHSCRGNVPELKPKETIVLAMDAGVSDDSFALCGVRKWQVDGVDVVYSRRWLPPQGGKISFTNPDNPNDRETPEGEIRYLCKAYNVVMVAYDPYQLEDMANRLGREGVAWFFAFTQGAQRLTADSNLRTLIREKRLRHNGDPDLTEHVLNAGAKTDSEDSKIRIVKRAQHLKTDLAVSLSMSAERCLYLNL